MGKTVNIIIGSDHLGENFPDLLQDLFPEANFIKAFDEKNQLIHIQNADVFFGFPSEKLIENGSHLQWIACPGTGIDKIINNAKSLSTKTIITNAPLAHVTPMAEHVVGTMVGLAHSFKRLFEDQSNKKWDVDQWNSKIVELKGGNVCIYGYGKLGQSIAKKLSAFEMNIFAIDPISNIKTGIEKSVSHPNDLNKILKISNWLIIASPLIKETENFIKKENLMLMPKNSYTVIISRGGIINEDDLYEALNSGHLAGAGIDATKIEPLPKSSPLWDVENAIISQHASALSPEMYEGRRKIFIENLRRFINGKDLLHKCDLSKGY
ncbi:MAG: hypothetical protein CL772_00640 [Chloroflexi bacterium]|nr:hypothetical protein [Chloroflexota bacterium]|tara:strand:+ start:16434 stop:17402 length:969 start_codon:yes stop_codon:yes gene_type:complete